MQPATLLLADSYRLMLEALNGALERRYTVVGLAGDGQELVARALASRPEIIVSDLWLPGLDALQALRQMRRAGVASRLVALSVHAQPSLAAEALRAGAAAYVLKQDSLAELQTALEVVLGGRAYVSARLAADPLALLLAGTARADGQPRLTPRQRQVLRMVAEGKTMKEAAALLGISIRTAESYKYDLMRRRGLRSNAEMVQYAIRLGLLPLAPAVSH